MSRQPTQIDSPGIVRIDAGAVLDAAAAAASPGSILIEVLAHPCAGGTGRPIWRARTLAAGRTADILHHPAAQSPATRVISRPNAILVPGFVNAHTHLDLTHIGPRPHDPQAGFVSWVDMIRRERRHTPEEIASSVRQGIALSMAAGTVAVGDIAGAPGGRICTVPWQTLLPSGLFGVSYLEFFGIGRTATSTLAALTAILSEVGGEAAQTHPVRLGLQPHAPNTVSRRLFADAARLAAALPGAPLATHLAETPEERRFVAEASGPQRELLERLGVWDDSILEDVGQARHPIEHLQEVLTRHLFTVAHVNDLGDQLPLLGRTKARVVYCPRASAYFEAERHFGPHQYREMINAGITVALGTDSIVNLPAEAALLPARGGRGMSILDEMRFLYQRDATDPRVLLRMGTIAGADALGLDGGAFTFAAGAPLAGLVAVEADPIRPGAPQEIAKALLGGSPREVELLFPGMSYGLTAK